MALVARYHGDVIKFAGDSLIIAFMPRSEETSNHDGGVESAVARSVACGWCMVRDLGEMIMLPKGQVVSASSLRRKGSIFNRLSLSQYTTSSSIRTPMIGSLGSNLSGSLKKGMAKALQGLKSTFTFSDVIAQHSGVSMESSTSSLPRTEASETQKFQLSIKVE